MYKYLFSLIVAALSVFNAHGVEIPVFGHTDDNNSRTNFAMLNGDPK